MRQRGYSGGERFDPPEYHGRPDDEPDDVYADSFRCPDCETPTFNGRRCMTCRDDE